MLFSLQPDPCRTEIFAAIDSNQQINEKRDIYTIALCAPPWWGSTISWITASFGRSLLKGRRFEIAKYDSWRMVPSSANLQNWNYYFNSSKVSSEFAPILMRLLLRAPSRFKTTYYRIFRRIPSLLSKSGIVFYFNSECSSTNFIVHDKRLWRLSGAANDSESEWAKMPKWADQIYSKYEVPSERRASLWKSYLCQYLFQPNERFANSIDFDSLNIPDVYIAIHCRRGDKVAGKYKESNYVPTQKYFDAAMNIHRSKGVSDVFLVTDNDDFIDEFIQLNRLNSDCLKIYFDQNEIRSDGFPTKLVQGGILENDLVVENEMNTALKNTSILTNARYLIGTKASWFFQVAFHLRQISWQTSHDFLIESDEEIPGHPYYRF